MSIPTKPLTIDDLSNNNIMKNYVKIYDANKDYNDDKLDNSDIHVYWYKLMDKFIKKIHYKQCENEIAKEDYSKLLEFFEMDTLVYVYINYQAYRSSEVFRALECLDSRFSIIDSLMSMSWQWYSEERDPKIVFQLWKTFSTVTDTQVFNDDRFSIHPIFTNAYQKGLDRSPWLKDMAAGWLNVYEETTGTKGLQKYNDGAYNSNFMDAKVGFVIYFKNMPSMLVSFNCDNDWNLYIHQIQCKPKDRGHYKLKNWQQSCLELVQTLFSDFDVHLIKGESLAKMIPDAYSQAEDVMKPTQETLKRITDIYNNMFNNFGSVIVKSNIQYHKIC
jgi:hypothetical protein